ncbi:hypothetical protein, partial [Tannerella forsythia]|uniref:hypothetical protein n=1 Tax=Tannerella forsythia TaxID=28112 RepID=UPI00242AA9AF
GTIRIGRMPSSLYRAVDKASAGKHTVIRCGCGRPYVSPRPVPPEFILPCELALPILYSGR